MEIYSYESYVEVQLNPTTTYEYELINQDTGVVSSGIDTTSAAGILSIPFEDAQQTTKYDAWYQLSIYIGSKTPESLIYIDTISKVRPYVNTAELSTYLGVTAEQAIEYESTARSLINSIIGYAFDYKRLQLELVGNGTDTLHTHERIVKVHSLKENNVLLWSTGEPDPFLPAKDYFGIRRSLGTQENNRLEFPAVWATRYSVPLFHEHYDYVADVDAGWPVVPEDIKKALKLLASDIACGTNRYSNKYIESTSIGTAQRIQYFDQVIAGTGNLLVDNLISPYVLNSVRARVL